MLYRVPTILMPQTFPIASLNRYTPNFSGVPLELTQSQQFGIQLLPKSGYPGFLAAKKGCFWAFFWRKKSFLCKTVDFNLQHVLQILKAIGPEVNVSYQSSLLKHPTRRQNFANMLQPHCAHHLTLRPRSGQCSFFLTCNLSQFLVMQF